jgi:CTP synthase (UTP-ammonia lyase)
VNASTVRIAVIGDFNPEFVAHTTTDTSLRDAAQALGAALDFQWVATDSLPRDGSALAALLDRFDGLWISAGSPYRNRDGVFAAIRYARERLRPMFAT